MKRYYLLFVFAAVILLATAVSPANAQQARIRYQVSFPMRTTMKPRFGLRSRVSHSPSSMW